MCATASPVRGFYHACISNFLACSLNPHAFPFSSRETTRENLITKVTFTLTQPFTNIHIVVWQFWGRAAEASWAEKSEALFFAR